MKVYISGPMTRLPNFNYPAFFTAARRLRELGHEPLNPAEQPTKHWKSRADYMRHDIKLLAQADAITLLDGWQESAGAKLEYEIAVQIELAVFDLDKGYVTNNLRWSATNRLYFEPSK